MNRAPELRRFLDGMASSLQINPQEQATLEAGGGHPYLCRCPVCKRHWQMVGPDPDTMECGPFSYEELGLNPADYAYLLENTDPPWANDPGLR